MNDEVENGAAPETRAPKDFESLVGSVSLELERDLRLHPRKLELGRLELLTDSIRLPFQDIERRLADLALTLKPQARTQLQDNIKRYLGRLNANPLLPLQFRLKVLDVLEKHLDLFDVEMAAQVLNAHKIGIQLVQREAVRRPEYLSPLIQLIAASLDLAERILFETLRAHRVPHVIALRQAMDLMRLGLLVVQEAGEGEVEDARALKTAIAAHELLRCMNMHARNEDEQVLVRQELRRYAGRVSPALYQRGRVLPEATNVWLVTQLHRPQARPEKYTRLPERAERDMIVLPLDDFLAAINHDIRLARRVARMDAGERKLLMTDQRFREISQGTTVIRQSLQSVSRAEARKRVEGARLLLETDAGKAFGAAATGALGEEWMDVAGGGIEREAWAVVNVSRQGVAIERLNGEWPEGLRCGMLVGLEWLGRRFGSRLGVVRWYSETKPGELRIGIEFAGRGLRPTRGMLLRGAKVGEMRRRLSLLFDPKDSRTVWFPLADVHAGDPLIYLLEGEGVRCHVAEVLDRGVNHCVCRIAFDGDAAGGFSVSAESLR
ncbi:MAG: hypothetical protein R8K47_05010 [Mariprofundaceae bacterium]